MTPHPEQWLHLTSGNKNFPVTHGEKRLLPRKCVQQNNQRSFQLKFHDSKSHLHNKGFVLGRACFVKITRFGGIQFSENRSAPGLKGKHLGISVSSPMRARISQRRCLQAGVEKVCSESLHEVFRAQRSHHTMSIYTMYIIYMIQYVYYVYYLYVCVCIYLYIYIFMCVRGFYCLSKVGWKIHSSGMTV